MNSSLTRTMTPGVSMCLVLKSFIVSRNWLYTSGWLANTALTSSRKSSAFSNLTWRGGASTGAPTAGRTGCCVSEAEGSEAAGATTGTGAGATAAGGAGPGTEATATAGAAGAGDGGVTVLAMKAAGGSGAGSVARPGD